MFLCVGQPAVHRAKYQSPEQREQMRPHRRPQVGRHAWIMWAHGSSKPALMCEEGTGSARIAFVATNSITQGEQVAQLWPLLFDRYRLEIAFAHRTFAWGSDARGVAHVHVVIIGLTRREDEPPEKRLFSYDDIKGDPVESRHAALSPYLIDGAVW